MKKLFANLTTEELKNLLIINARRIGVVDQAINYFQ